MPLEIEWKMRLEQSEIARIRKSIACMAPDVVAHDILKEDTYYGYPHDRKPLFRVRNSGNSLVVTRKEKELRADGIELNREMEIDIPSRQSDQVHRFFVSLGFVPVISKRKSGNSWNFQNLTIELVHVEHLGWFLEVETLIPSDSCESERTQAIAHLGSVRTRLGLDGRALESRYYIEMLQDIENNRER